MNSARRADELLAGLRRDGRGRLKLFLGAAPGVGKTYAMLQAAHRQVLQGVSVRVGIVETHGRSETAALVVGLPQQATRPVPYRGMTLAELDLDGLLKSPPSLVLVDELAHTNAPGSRHAKRWQDVQELLTAGIDVYSAINVQHLESLNDQILDITGIRVRETVPDWVIHDADEILLIDLPARELLERLREGKVYVPDQARAAIDAFFSQTNLTALRELAMQTAAARIEADLDRRAIQLGEPLPAVRGRLILGITGDLQAGALVRYASRVAERRHLPWSAVHVDDGKPTDEAHRTRLQSARQLAERLGGEAITLHGDPPKALVEHALERRANVILVGRTRARLRWKRTLQTRLVTAGRGLEISIVDSQAQSPSITYRPSTPLRWGQYLLALLASSMATGMAMLVSRVLDLPDVALVFLSAVLLVAVRTSVGPALTCAGLSFLAYNWFFIDPVHSLTIARQQDVLSLAFFLLMATLTGNLASRQRRQLESIRSTQRETSTVLELSRQLTAATDRKAILAATMQQLEGHYPFDVVILRRDSQTEWSFESGVRSGLTEQERAAADWAWRHRSAAGRHTDTLPDCSWWWLPLVTPDGTQALLGARSTGDEPLSPERRRLLSDLGQLVAQALGRAQLAQDLEAARLHGETEQLRSALLASVSHDLRTPLTTMRGSIDTLLVLGRQISEQDRQTLLRGTRDEADRLDRYIQNLLDMTRLGQAGLQITRTWVAPAEIVASATARLRSLLNELNVIIDVADTLPMLHVHGALIEQALINIIENAARFSPLSGTLEIRALIGPDTFSFVVTDQGPGIPPEERARIFDMFYTAARGDRGGKGTGLGLAICQGMVGAHGGRVSVSDGPGGLGTSVTLSLPIQLTQGHTPDGR